MRNEPDSTDMDGPKKSPESKRKDHAKDSPDQNPKQGPRFARKLLAAFGAMLLVILALAWYFYDSVEWYEHDIQRIALGNQVLQNYQALAVQTWQAVNATDRATPETHNAQAWAIQADSLRATVQAIRSGIQNEAEFREPGDADDSASRLEHLADIEQVLDQILLARQAVSEHLQAGDANAAEVARDRLHEAGLVTLFTRMVEQEIAGRGEEVHQTQVGVIGLAGYLSGLMPLFAVVLIAVTVLMAWLFSRSLTRSVRALHDGAVAFSAGDLSYRIPELKEAEFRRLGAEFNTMARELADHREQFKEAHVRLEGMIEERTRALKSSNTKLEAIDDNRRQLLADISHEFRTPLTVIQGEAEIALRGESEQAGPYRETLERILEQVRQTTRLVDDLLFIARAEVGEPRLHLAEAPVAELLAAVCADFAAAAKRKEMALACDIPEVGPVVTADSGRLRQVFTILLDNAIKYSKEGGEVEVGLAHGDGKVTVTVADRGIGLSEEELRHVFERYYRGSKAAHHEGGTGLGLPVARAIVEAHGGEIVLESREGGGLVSTVCLPMTQAGSKGAAA